MSTKTNNTISSTRPGKRVTIKEVAEHAGVSLQTISRVVNASQNVADETRQRVLQAIAELGYRRSELARHLNQGRSYTLGAVGSDVGYVGTGTFLGIARQADALGYSLQLKELSVTHTEEEARNVLHGLADRLVDGILWALPEIGDNHAWLDSGLLDEIPVPVIFLSMRPRSNFTVVAYDNFEGGTLAMRHLIENGRRTIGHIAGPLNWWVSQERIRAWEENICHAELSFDPTRLTAGNWEASSGLQAMHTLLDRHPEIDAVFAANDKMALGALLAAHQRRLRIPEDIAIVGFDNTPESACFFPPLTTIIQDKVQLGELATRVLVHHAEARFSHLAPTKIDTTSLSQQLFVRESS
ncbi:MAG: LacI family DNA-binding transcriptional regulator [Formivibrio sp.]|nr:LacI family DNA-binding transcriptional regulator [Formivibrio sp.]